MYPLSMSLAAPDIGFAVANNQAEHQALSALGYGPKFVVPAQPNRDALLAQAKEKGVKVDGRWSDERLAEELSKV